MPLWEQLATDQFDTWQVVPRQIFTPYFRLLISTAFLLSVALVVSGYPVCKKSDICAGSVVDSSSLEYGQSAALKPTKHLLWGCAALLSKYSRASVARTLMTRLPRLFRTCS